MLQVYTALCQRRTACHSSWYNSKSSRILLDKAENIRCMFVPITRHEDEEEDLTEQRRLLIKKGKPRCIFVPFTGRWVVIICSICNSADSISQPSPNAFLITLESLKPKEERHKLSLDIF